MNTRGAMTVIVALLGVIAAAVEGIPDLRWRALAVLVSFVAVWLFGLHTPVPRAEPVHAPHPPLTLSTNGSARPDFAEMVEEFRGMRASFERLIEVQTRDMAEHAKFRDRFEALETARTSGRDS